MTPSPSQGRGWPSGPLDPATLLSWVLEHREAFVDYLTALAAMESPTDVPESQGPVQEMLADSLGELGFRVRRHRGRETGGLLLAHPADRRRGAGVQLLVGHTDTVWPLGTKDEMPVHSDGERLYGPGVFDMKAGLTQMVFALRALRELGADPLLTPVLLLNSDEETGSPESGRWVRRLARVADRAFVPEPSWGPEGLLKTARKGVGAFTVRIRGRPAHAGLDPGAGASAVGELATVIQRLHALTDPGTGTTVNVGVVEGGTRPNVVAAHARAEVDVRVATLAEGRRIEEAVLGLEPLTPGVSLEIAGGMRIPPLERTPRNRRLWGRAREAAEALALPLGETMVGGASDGSVISGHTATLDGLGAVGDGAHARHEHAVVDATVRRVALLALLLLAPPDSAGSEV